MFERKKIMWLYGLTSAHVGSGDNLSYIDLPIQREKHTKYPKIEASSLKGSIRQAMERKDTKDDKDQYPLTNKLLGSSDNGDIASAISMSDARILFFPVKSAKGVFAWITSPLAMQRFRQDCRLAGFDDLANVLNDLNFEDEDKVYRCKDSLLLVNETQILLEEFDFEPEECSGFENWLDAISKYFPDAKKAPLLEKEVFKKRVVMIPDNDFSYFVTQSTEVSTRIKVDSDTGIVAKGALFTEECLPPESILYSLLFFSDERVKITASTNEEEKNKVLTSREVEIKMGCLLKDRLLQIGGNRTHGKGLFRISWEAKECNNK